MLPTAGPRLALLGRVPGSPRQCEPRRGLTQELVQELTQELAQELAQGPAQELAQDLAQDLTQELELPRRRLPWQQPMARARARPWTRREGSARETP
jgi:hypothetical protein